MKYLIFSVLCFIVVYGCIEAWPLVYGPTLSITSPLPGASYPSGVVAVSGTALRAAVLSLNGLPILHEADGTFLSTLTLPRGSSILTLVATDRFGRRAIDTRTVFVPFEN